MFPFLGVHADHRLASGLVLVDLVMDVAELRISIRVLGSLQRLGVRLQAEARRPKQPAHRGGGHRVPLLGKLFGQMS